MYFGLPIEQFENLVFEDLNDAGLRAMDVEGFPGGPLLDQDERAAFLLVEVVAQTPRLATAGLYQGQHQGLEVGLSACVGSEHADGCGAAVCDGIGVCVSGS